MPYQKEGIPMLAGKGNFVFLTPSARSSPTGFWKNLHPAGSIFPKNLARLNTSLTWPAKHRNTGSKAGNCLIIKNKKR